MIHVNHLEIHFTKDPYDPATVLAVIDQRGHRVAVGSTHGIPAPSELATGYYTTERCGMLGDRVRFRLREFIKIWKNRGGTWI